MEPQLADLLGRVVTALRRLPGAQAITLFGSCADHGRADAYSDLDLHVTTVDYAACRPLWPGALRLAGEIELAFPVEATANGATFSVAFTSESPYHKLDVGLAGPGDRFLESAPVQQELWLRCADGPVAMPADSALAEAARAAVYVPKIGSPACFLAGEALSLVRYVKARRRGQHLVCWRFASAKLNARLRVDAWDGDPLAFPTEQLSTWDLADLDRRLAEDERLARLSTLRGTAPPDMDRAVLNLTAQMVEVIWPGLEVEDIPAVTFAQHNLNFATRELGMA